MLHDNYTAPRRKPGPPPPRRCGYSVHRNPYDLLVPPPFSAAWGDELGALRSREFKGAAWQQAAARARCVRPRLTQPYLYTPFEYDVLTDNERCGAPLLVEEGVVAAGVEMAGAEAGHPAAAAAGIGGAASEAAAFVAPHQHHTEAPHRQKRGACRVAVLLVHGGGVYYPANYSNHLHARLRRARTYHQASLPMHGRRWRCSTLRSLSGRI